MSPERAYFKELPKRPEELKEEKSSAQPLVPEPREILENQKSSAEEKSIRTQSNHMKPTDNPFEPSENGLLIVNGFINTHPVSILIDDGSEVNYVSSTICSNIEAPLKPEEYEAVMANKTKSKIHSTANKLQLSIGPYSESMRFAVSDLGHDVVLGKKRTSEHNAVICSRTNEVEFVYKGKQHRILANQSKPSDEISLNSISKPSNLDSPMFAVILKPHLSTTKETPDTDFGLQQVMSEFADVFPEKLPKGLPPKRTKDYSIELVPETKPVKKGLYRMSDIELQEVKEKIQELLEQGFIRPSASPWGSPILFVSKKDGGLRFCIDYRALNKLTVKNCYPLPRIDDLLDCLASAKYYSKIDLMMGYHQVRLSEESIPRTAFRTKYGSFEFLVLPFGLTNAPSFFMTLMNEVFADFIDKFMVIYLDDILIYSESWEDHLEHIRKVLHRLREHKLYAKRSKCTFGVKTIDYLGFILNENNLCVDPNKSTAIEAWETPKTKKDVQSFLGLVNFYRRFIKDCAKIAKPLTSLTKDVPFKWSPEADKAFKTLKTTIVSAPVLRTFHPEYPITITTDASKFAVGAVLEQDFQDGRHPVAYISKTLNPAQQNYAPHNAECWQLCTQ